MTNLFANKAVYATIFVLFTLAVLVNTLAGGSLPTFGAFPLIQSSPVLVADGPLFPPDPWDNSNANTWAKLDGPLFPPDPWDDSAKSNWARLDGPLFPPDPWDDDTSKDGGNKRTIPMAIADGPLFPPDPWDDDDKSKDGSGGKRS